MRTEELLERVRIENMRLNTANLEGKFYLSGFPKAGLHLVDLMIRPMAMPLDRDPVWATPWAGMYIGNSWTTTPVRSELTGLKISRLIPGHFLKGHIGCVPWIRRFLYHSGITHYFIYRDLRDVAVSQTYHIMSEDADVFSHPDKEGFNALGSFSEVLAAVLEGRGIFAGLFERWELYAPWLDVDWTMTMRFEDVLTNPLEWAKKMIVHFYDRMETILDLPHEKRQITDEQLEDIAMEMVATSLRKQLSPTFRKGLIGEWETHFNDQNKDLFKQLDVNNWLVKLGYEEDKDW